MTMAKAMMAVAVVVGLLGGTAEGAVVGGDRLWPNCEIPYMFSGGMPGGDFATNMRNGIRLWEYLMPELKFREKTADDKHYIHFKAYWGGGQGPAPEHCGVNPDGPNVIELGSWCGQACVARRIAYAMGLGYENLRNDRDQHVTINFDNVADDKVALFDKLGDKGQDLFAYDHKSVLHWASTAYAKKGADGKPLTTIESSEAISAWKPSPADVAALRFLYNSCKPATGVTCAASVEGPQKATVGKKFVVTFVAVSGAPATVAFTKSEGGAPPTPGLPRGATVSEQHLGGHGGLHHTSGRVEFTPEKEGSVEVGAVFASLPAGLTRCAVTIDVEPPLAVPTCEQPKGCYGASCDHWVAATRGALTCDVLAKRYLCDCSGCACGQ